LLATLNSVELSTAQLAFLKAYSQRLLAQRAAQRAEQLLEADVIGRAELQRRQSEFAQAEAEVSAARDQLMVLGMSESAVAGLTSDRSVNSQAAVRASISGTVLERKVTQGQVVQPADTMFLVADLSRVWLVAEVPEQQATLIRRGETVEAEIASLPGDRLAGTLSFIGAIVNPETRTITARMELDNADRRFKPAMLATMFIKGRPERRLAVPVPAVVRDENRDYVFVQAGPNQFALRLVNLGAEYEGRRHVISGLSRGDRIVVDGAFHLNNERKRNALGS
jgi:cobalt-zinc-cadmium efflux system membrane fusion protein